MQTVTKDSRKNPGISKEFTDTHPLSVHELEFLKQEKNNLATSGYPGNAE